MLEFLTEHGISAQMITSAVITLVLCILAIVLGRNIQNVPDRKQSAAEIAVEKLYNFFLPIMGEKCTRKCFPLIATIFIYVLCCNYSGLLPLSGHLPFLAAPTSSINFPMAIAIVVFFTTQIVGIREARGLRFFKHLLRPYFFLFPIMLAEQFVRPVSLTLRLYGNIFGEEAVTSSFFSMVPIGVPVIMQFLSVLMGLVQALVFSLLSAIYISEAMEEAENL